MIPAPRPRWAGPLLLLAALLAYAAVLGGSFQFDDFNVIVDEPGVHSLGAWAAGLGGIRPLLKLSYALNWTLHPGATGFLATNLAIHLAASWMVHRLLLWIFAAAGMEEARQAPAAFLGALIFALHPAQVEAVAYVTGRSASLSAALMLASALAYLRGREGRAWTLGSVALFLLALAAKETALILPALLILLELARPKGERRPFRGPLLHWAFALGGVALLATLPFYHRLAAFSFALRSPGAQARAALVGLGYLGRVLLWPARLNIDPPLRTPEAWSAGLLMLAAAWVLMALLGVLALRGRRRWLGVGLLWMLLALLPTQGPMARLDLASERHLYLALAGAGMVAGGLLSALPLRVFWLCASILALALGVRSFVRVLDYRDETRLWNASIAAAPGNPRAWNNLGVARWHAQDLPGARRAFQEALRQDPQYRLAERNLGRCEE